MASVFRLQDRIAGMAQYGASLDRIEKEVIDPSDLNSDQKAALWLYARSFVEGREQRAEAARQLMT